VNYYFLFLSALLSSSISFGQKAIDNQLTAEHQLTAGTKVSIIPPDGFNEAANFSGYQQEESGSSIMIIEMPASFSLIESSFTEEGLLAQGIEMNSKKELTINNYRAIYITGEQNARGNSYVKNILVFGDDQKTVILNAASPTNLNEISKAIKEALLTMVYQEDLDTDPLEAVSFEIDTDTNEFRFASSLVNSLMYTHDGIIPTKSEDRANLMVAMSVSEVEVEDKKLYSINRVKGLPMEIDEFESIEEVTIDGISGYELITTGKSMVTDLVTKIYVVILYSDDVYYLAYGSCISDFDANIEIFKRTIKTFRRK
jgi:hypothetical protein